MQQDKRQQKEEGGVGLTGREAEGRLGQKNQKKNKGKIEFFSEGNRGGKPFTKQLICRLLF